MNTAPKFWNHRSGLSSLLLPASWLWRAATAIRLGCITGEKARLPVLCVGNILVGGTGKTPFVAYLCQLLRQRGARPVILTRGYGGKYKGPIFADPAFHQASDIGDEALMLSHHENVCISRDRVAGAAFIAAHSDADVIIMDDGMQNPWLKKDLTIAVFDGAVGLSNQRVLPAGPLRQPLSSALPMMDIAVINGADKTGLAELLSPSLSCLPAQLIPNPETAKRLKGQAVLGFAGIGRPERFFDTLRDCGANLVKALPFGDHHTYSEADLTRLHLEATQLGAELITTQKDWVRLPPEWRDRIRVLDVRLELENSAQQTLLNLILPLLNLQES